MSSQLPRALDIPEDLEKIKDLLCANSVVGIREELMEKVRKLAQANFDCFLANMKILDARRRDKEGLKDISDAEWVARSVGELRVRTKAEINQRISDHAGRSSPDTTPLSWETDDVVYSIAEMLDRLIIEAIKRQFFILTGKPKESSDISKAWSDRVYKHMSNKLLEIDRKGFYESIREMRTYTLDIEQENR